MITQISMNGFRCMMAAAVFGSLLGIAGTARAASPIDALQTTVKFNDLDLSKPAGAALLYARIQAAAGRVCQPWDGKGLSSKVRHDACMRSAIDAAVNQVGRQELTALRDATYKPSHPIVLVAGPGR